MGAMRVALLAVVGACSFEHGTVPKRDAKPDVDARASSDASSADARGCPPPPAGLPCQSFTCAGHSSCYLVCGGAVLKYNHATAASACNNAGGCLVTVSDEAERMCLAAAT